MGQQSLKTCFIVGTLPKPPMQLKPGEYHYPKLISAAEIRSALEASYKKIAPAMHPDNGVAAFLVDVNVIFKNTDDLKSQLLEIQQNIAKLTGEAQTEKQHINVHVKDVYSTGLKREYDIDIPWLHLNA